MSNNNKLYTIDELIEWSKCPTINPKTKRIINQANKLYKLIEKQYFLNKFEIDNKLNKKEEININQIDISNIVINEYNLLDSVDDRDPITMTQFWIEEDNIKKIVYPLDQMDELVFYYDKSKLLRCFEKESLGYLKKYNILIHPITSEVLPLHIFNNIEKIVKTEEKLNTELALEVFQHFSKISIFIKHELFMELPINSLIKFNYELNEFWLNNFTITQRNIITKLTFKTTAMLEKHNIHEIQLYLLNIINKLLQCDNEAYKYMLNYIVLGALSIVIPTIKNEYPDIAFAF